MAKKKIRGKIVAVRLLEVYSYIQSTLENRGARNGLSFERRQVIRLKM